MARMYPEALSNDVLSDPKRGAEVRVYEALRDRVSDEYVAFYSVTWVTPFRVDGALHDGEADFIVAHPQLGILILEVKGGRIDYYGAVGCWTQTDVYGVEREINPFAQALRSKYFLRDKIRSLPGWRDEADRLCLGHGVIFPDTALHPGVLANGLPPEADARIVIDGHGMVQLPQRLSEIMAAWRGEKPAHESAFGRIVEEMLIQTIAPPRTTLRNPLALTVREEDDRVMLTLTTEQMTILKYVQRYRRVSVAGCAGSGKTMVAVEKARRLAAEGFTPLLVCRSEPLAKHLRRVTQGIDGVTVYSFFEWCIAVAQSTGIPAPVLPNGQPDWGRYPDLLLTANATHSGGRLNALLIDEGQDFEEEWWAAVSEVLAPDAVLYVFYDDNQKVRQTAVAIPDGLGLLPFNLEENVRNTRPIYSLLAHYYESPTSTIPRGPAGRQVVTRTYPEEDEAALGRLLSKTLHDLLINERFLPSEVVILTPRTSLAESALPDLLAAMPHPQRQVRCLTVTDFKGLESSVVVLAELDALFEENPCREAVAYVAFSRPRSHLVLLGDPRTLDKFPIADVVGLK